MLTIFGKTPSVKVLDNRGLNVRNIAYCRHPDTPAVTSERIARHGFNARGFLQQSADPRLYVNGEVNFIYMTDLLGHVLCEQSSDAGTTIALNDNAGRIFLSVTNIGFHGERERSLTRSWQYEKSTLPGRLLSLTEQVAGDNARVMERFVYGSNTQSEQDNNLSGQCISHYDPVGLVQVEVFSLHGVPLSVTRRLLRGAEDANTFADWQGSDVSVWNDSLASENYTTLTTVDAIGSVLATIDAVGNVQRIAYDVAGLVKSCWLTINGGKEQPIVTSITYSAAGQKLVELHGNGVMTTWTYEKETQRLVGIKTERPTTHPSGAKVLQDLRYEYDPVGNVLVVSNDAEETRFWRNQEIVPRCTYSYDSLYQLIRATGREMADARQQSSALPVFSSFDDATYTNYSRTYRYDTGNNLIQIQQSAPASGNSYTTTMTVSNSSNRAVLSSLTEAPAQVDTLFTYGGQQTVLFSGQPLTWTPRGELQKVVPVVRNSGSDDSESYRYDARSQRIMKVTSQQTGGGNRSQKVIYLPGLEWRITTNGGTVTENLQVITTSVADQVQVRALHWESGLPGDISANDQLRWSYGNLIGSCQLEVDGDGYLISQEEYYPFGGTALLVARNQTEVSYKTLRYSSKELDATGLYYYGYRYYQPWGGRWLSADPEGGLNLYCMVHNNPLTLKDPDGRAPILASRSFGELIGNNEFAALDRLLHVPDSFIESENNPVIVRGNIQDEPASEGSETSSRSITVSWERKIPHFQPTHESELVEEGAAVSEAFAKDLHRSVYTTSYAALGMDIPFSAADVDQFFSPQNKKILSTVAHQGHLADIAIELYGVRRVDDDNTFSAKRDSKPEHLIVHEGDVYRITSRQQFEMKNMDTEEYLAEGSFSATVEQTTYLDATNFDASGSRLLTYQTKDKPSTQRIVFKMRLPNSPPTTPTKKGGLFSRMFSRQISR